VEPLVDELVELHRVLGGEVVRLGRIVVGVVELPAVLVEVAPAGDRRVDGHRLPALVPDGA
jgi:hypothetical protein